MQQHEMQSLISAGIPAAGGTWADLGAGTGNFTWALAALLGADATIYAIDRDARAVAALQQRSASDPPRARIIPQQADVVRLPQLPLLDGILAANLLHFIRDQAGLLRRLAPLLKPGGVLIIVEYDQPHPIPWVPFPLAPAALTRVASQTPFAAPEVVGTRVSPSSGRAMYAARLLKT